MVRDFPRDVVLIVSNLWFISLFLFGFMYDVVCNEDYKKKIRIEPQSV